MPVNSRVAAIKRNNRVKNVSFIFLLALKKKKKTWILPNSPTNMSILLSRKVWKGLKL